MRVRSVLLFASVTLCPVTRCPAVTVADISQHPVVRLTENGAVDHQPVLSADGSRLAWTGCEDPSDYNSAWDIYLADQVDGVWQAPTRRGTPGARDFSPHLSDDGNTLANGGGRYPGLCHQVHVRECADGIWGVWQVLFDARDRGYWAGAPAGISGDGLTIVALFDPAVAPWGCDCYIIRRRDGNWGTPVFLVGLAYDIALNYDGTRLCVGKYRGLEVYDLTAVPRNKWVLEKEEPNVCISDCTMSDDGRRVAYEWEYIYSSPRRIRLREERDGDWDLTEFHGFSEGVISRDGTALLLFPKGTGLHYFDPYLYTTRFVDGEWHEPICIAAPGTYPMPLPATSRDGRKIAFSATETPHGPQFSEELYFFSYEFPGKAVVRSNIPSAPFTISGPIELSRATGPDCRWECDQLYVSTWTVTWGDVPYYETPPPQTQQTKVDETVYFCGEYVPSIYRLEPDEVELSVGRPVLNYATGTFFVPVEIRNMTGQITFYAPMRLVFDSFSPENTRLWNGDGLTEDGKPFIDLTDLIPNGLAPDSPPLLVEVEIYNRERNPFISFEAHVTAAKAPLPDVAFTPQAADGGSASSEPRLSEEQSALRIESITLDARGVKIAWRSIAGQNYRVLHRDVLLTEWQDTAEVTATGPTTEWLDESASEESPPMRVYRIEGIPSPALKPGD
ncbi:MAG: hypothetical protein Q8Q12_11640 [bacterium]|nr:hypothetical protein [bacterium]